MKKFYTPVENAPRALEKLLKKLRLYQRGLFHGVRGSYRAGHRAPLIQLATGAGKTFVFGAITAAAVQKHRRVLIVAPRRELIRQASEKLDWAGVAHGIMAADLDRDHSLPVQVGSVQSLSRRLDRLPQFDLIIFDEAHHARAETWANLIGRQPQARLLGVTATPARGNGQGLGIRAGGCFDDLVIGPSTAALIDGGWLCRVRCFVPERRVDTSQLRVRAGDFIAEQAAALTDIPVITGDAVESYRRYADHRPAIVFTVLVSHAEHVAEAFRAAGYKSYAIHGALPKNIRDDLLRGLASGDVEVLCACDLISEGLDVHGVAIIILLRPTRSLVLHRQQIGRGMRTSPGKAALIVCDHVGNTLRHGPPEIEPLWSLSGIDKSEALPIWQCPRCNCVIPLAQWVCPQCGYQRPAPETGRKRPITIPGALAEFDRASWLIRLPYHDFVARFKRGQLSETDAYTYAASRGYEPGWVWHRTQERARVLATRQT